MLFFWFPAALPSELHFYAEGRLYLEKYEKVVEKKLGFFLPTNCTTNITSYLNNIRPVAGIVLQDSSLNEISKAELDRTKDRGFDIEDVDSVPIKKTF